MKSAKQILVALVGLVVVMAAARAGPVGMVLDVEGPVTADLGGRGVMLDIASPLNATTRIHLGQGSMISFVVYAARQQFTAKGPALLQVLDQSVKQLQGATPLQIRPLPENRSAAALGFQNRVVPAAMVMKTSFDVSPRPKLLEPLNGETVLAAQPEFVWINPTDSAVDFSLTLDDGTPVHQQRVTGTRLVLPATLALLSGREYRWQVVPVGNAEVVAPSRGTFTVPAAALRDHIQKDKPPSSAALADWLLYAMVLDQANMRIEAHRIWKRLAEQRPESSALQALVQ